MIRSASRTAAVTSWVTNKTAAPVARQRFAPGPASRAEDQHRGRRTAHPSAPDRARWRRRGGMATRLCMPPGSSVGRLARSAGVKPKLVSNSAARARLTARSIPIAASPKAVFSRAVAQGNRRGSWNTMAVRWNRFSIRPSAGFINPAAIFSAVVLPQPDGPRSATSRPGSTLRSSRSFWSAPGAPLTARGCLGRPIARRRRDPRRRRNGRRAAPGLEDGAASDRDRLGNRHHNAGDCRGGGRRIRTRPWQAPARPCPAPRRCRSRRLSPEAPCRTGSVSRRRSLYSLSTGPFLVRSLRPRRWRACAKARMKRKSWSRSARSRKA